MLHSVKNTIEEESKLTFKQVEFIKTLQIPTVMEIIVGSEFDTPHIQTKDDRWEYIRLGRKHVEIYNLNEHTNKLLKALSVKFTAGHMSPLGSVRFRTLKKIIRESVSISFSCFHKRLEMLAKANKAMDYFLLKSVTKILIRIGFPDFDIEDEETIMYLPTPNVANPFLRYEDIENTMPTHFKTLIVNRLVEFSTKDGLKSLSDSELKSLSVLGLAYSIGPRPQQFAMLRGNSVRIVATNHKTSLMRYQVSVPLAKQQVVPSGELQIALSQEVGLIIDEYKKRFDIGEEDPLYPYNSESETVLSVELHAALNNALLFIQTDETKEHIKQNTKARPIYTLYDFRHNIGHSMAMLNASAEEIAAVLGHTTTVAAQNYIKSTPELSLLKHKSLGQNPVWKDMIGLLLTGYLVDEDEWMGKTISGILKGQFFHRIGGCSRNQEKCHLVQVRSCYGCFYFRPFKSLVKHEKVLEIISEELFELVKVSHHSGNKDNPLIDTATQTKNEVEMVINRLKRRLR